MADSTLVRVSDKGSTVVIYGADLVKKLVDDGTLAIGAASAAAAASGTATINTARDAAVGTVNTTRDAAVGIVNGARDTALVAVGAQVGLADAHRYAAGVSAAQAQAAAEASGDVAFFDTHAAALVGLAALPADRVVEVFNDETRGSRRSRYRKESGALVFKRDLTELPTSPGFRALLHPRLTELGGADVRPIASRLNDGFVYGQLGGALYRSASDGATGTWAQYGPNNVLGGASPSLLLWAGDGQVLILSANSVHKTAGWGGGTFTAALKHSNTTTASFTPWGFDTAPAAGLAVVTHYDAASFTQSRYVWGSQDYGETWAVIRDLNSDGKNDRHLHFATFDPWHSNRLWIGHHDAGAGSGKAIEYSDNFGATWTEATITILDDAGATRAVQPTTAVAMPSGMLFGSDDTTSGLFIIRRDNPAGMVLERFASGPPEDFQVAVRCFATYSQRDPTTGYVYTVFRQQVQGGLSFIMVNDDHAGSVVWSETATLPHGLAGEPGLPGFDTFGLGRTHIVARTRRPSVGTPANQALWQFRALKARAGVPNFRLTTDVLGGRTGAGGVRNTSVGFGSQALGIRSLASGYGAKATSTDVSIALGPLSEASGNLALAVGDTASAIATAFAVGHNALASGSWAMAIGHSAFAEAGIAIGNNAISRTQSVIIGRNVQLPAGQSQAVLIGDGSIGAALSVALGHTATSLSSGVAIGYQSVSGSGVAVGRNARRGTTSAWTRTTMVGRDSLVDSASGTALGDAAQCLHSRSIALGVDSVTTAADQAHVGQRTITGTRFATVQASPPATGWTIYAVEVGGKTQLRAAFGSGAQQILATEP